MAPAEKPRARELVAEAVEAGGYGRRRLLVRVNGLDTEWGEADLARGLRRRAGRHPAAEGRDAGRPRPRRDLMRAPRGAGARTIWAMMETPRGMLNAGAIAGAHPRLEGFVMGTNDLVKELGAAHTPDRLPLVASLGLCLLAARAEGLVCVDGVYNAFQDADGLRAACMQGREMGFDGKTLIHPDQIAVANEVFAPRPTTWRSPASRWRPSRRPRRAARGGGGDGRIVENLHVATARRLLARAAAIAELEVAS